MQIKIIKNRNKHLMQDNKVLDMVTKGKIPPSRAIYLINDKKRKKMVGKESQISNEERELEVLNELNELVGLESIKKNINEIRAFVKIQKRRQEENLQSEPQVLHMIFKGNPGTGKTTVARIIGRLLKELGVLSKGHLLEVERADLVGEYIGHTAQKTKEQLDKAMGGVLFLDEAYSLARGGEKDFGREAIDSLVKSMEDYKDKFILILAGYCDEMEQFLRSNPGLRSRFSIHIDFPDYTIDNLIQIGELMLSKREYSLSPAARETLKRVLEYTIRLHEHQGNARMVRNVIEKAIRLQAVRLIKKKSITRDDLMTILPEDIEGARDHWLKNAL